MFNRLVNFNNKTEVNGEDLNTMVKKAIKAALEGGGGKAPKVVATYIYKSSNEDEAFGIYRINLED